MFSLVFIIHFPTGTSKLKESQVLLSQFCGFEEEEVAKALEAGAHAITLGRRILRTETAGLAILSVLMFQLENE